MLNDVRVAIVWLLASSPVFAVMTSDRVGSHATVPGQMAFEVNVDGVVTLALAWESDPSVDWSHSCTAALITDRQILSSAHCFDGNRDGKVDEWQRTIPHVVAFDLAEGRVILSVALDETRFPPQWYESDEDADLAVLQLVEIAPAGAPRYPLYGGQDETSHPFVLAGYGDIGHGATGAEGPVLPYPLKQAGMNHYDAAFTDFLVYDFDSGETAHNALERLGIPSDLGYGMDEVSAAWGDSGAPTFIKGAIAGVVARGLQEPEFDYNDFADASWGEWGEDTRVSSYRTFLIDATNGLVRWVGVAGDFDQDGRLMVSDVDLLSQQIRSGIQDAAFDLTQDGRVDLRDHDSWVKQLRKTYFGDANLDGSFDGADFVNVIQTGQYEDAVEFNSTWATGDWNGDGDFTTSDLVGAFQDGGYEKRPCSCVAEIPEPTSIVMLIAGACGLLPLRPHR